MPRHSSRINLTCQQCGITFTAKSYPSRALTGRGKYCSQSCYWNSKKRFDTDAWNHVDKSAGPDECWPWQGTMTVYGYGQFKCQSGLWRAHRLIFILTNGPVPSELVVRHKCDNRQCCNPRHLEIGTHDDNMKDAVTRKRMASGDRSFVRSHPEKLKRGESNSNAKLNEDKVREIRILIESQMPIIHIANKFGVCATTISNIRSGKIWVHVL